MAQQQTASEIKSLHELTDAHWLNIPREVCLGLAGMGMENGRKAITFYPDAIRFHWTATTEQKKKATEVAGKLLKREKVEGLTFVQSSGGGYCPYFYFFLLEGESIKFSLHQPIPLSHSELLIWGGGDC